ncbi:RadC family protein [Thalassolituus oleivorans]|uniref:RadC family protein n=1 Tax=Thalassolituus oleivorans TaxID=187493 RepID=UPI0024092BA2|nr:DNA repair protein RadC [Thalassolituus oleivorans]MDF1640440.1 DNA repair protein RadC [Thalassolituus oleivorans]
MNYVTTSPMTAREVLEVASNLLTEKYKRGDVFTSPEITRQFLTDKLTHLEHEVFAVVFLDAQNRLIEYQEMFRGTIDGAAVYPREVVKEALRLNAAAVIFAHNHPSGIPEPSQADRSITDRLSQALRLVDIRVVDHLVIGGQYSVSFAERGYL